MYNTLKRCFAGHDVIIEQETRMGMGNDVTTNDLKNREQHISS